MNENFYDYTHKEESTKKPHFNPLIEFSSKLSFEDFSHIQYNGVYFAIDSFLFSSSGRWGIYTNPNIDLMIFATNRDIKPQAHNYWNNNKEKITSLDFVIDDVYTWAKNQYADSIIDKINLNYCKIITK